MISLYPHLVTEWLTEPDRHPERQLLERLDRFIEGTMETMTGENQTDPDRWGEAMKDVLEAEFGEAKPVDLHTTTIEERMYWQAVRDVLKRLVDHYFSADWETEAGTEDLG